MSIDNYTNNMKTLISILTIILIITSCTDSEKKNQNVNPLIKERILLLSRKLDHVSRLGNENLELHQTFSNHLSHLFIMFRKIESANLESQQVDFQSDYNYFKTDKLIDLKFWNESKDLSIDKAILILDHLIFEFERSNYCNDWFKFSGVEVGFENTKEYYKQNSTDSIGFIFEGRSSDFIPQYYLNDDKNNSILSRYLKLDLSEKGKKTIKGFVMVRKINRFEIVPFKYSYQVK